MLLSDLLENEDPRVAAIRNKIASLKAERKALVSQFAGSGFQSGIDPRYATHVKRLDAAIAVAGQDLTAALARPSIEQGIRDADRQLANSIVPRTGRFDPDHGDSIKRGVEHWKELAAKYGDEHQLNVAILNAAKKQTQNGVYPLDVKSLAREFDVPSRSMYARIDTMAELRPLKNMFRNK